MNSQDFLYIIVIVQSLVITAMSFALYRSFPPAALGMLQFGLDMAKEYAAKTPNKEDDRAVVLGAAVVEKLAEAK